jgi:tubulin polyglutamylase TTLL4
MEAWARGFSKIDLPYEYVHVPQPDEPANIPVEQVQYRVNRVVTNLTRAAFRHAGFLFTTDTECWNASWGRQYSMNQYADCQSWQKVNHFAGAFLMGRKDNLHARMQELKSRVGDFASFYPESYLLPAQLSELSARWHSHPIWIMKPSASSRGRGIHLLSSDTSLPPLNAGVVQVYIPRPFLITNRKFDIRLYAFVPSIRPLRIYMHKSGLARFCTHEYDENGSPDDLHMHLTNFSLNKNDQKFIRAAGTEESIDDSKWSLDFWLAHLRKSGIDTAPIMAELERVTVATIIAGMCKIKETHVKVIPHRHTSYELYGIDILLDSDLNAHLIEINISPSLSGMDSTLDAALKLPLNLDVLRLARIIECDSTLDDPCPGLEALDDEYWKSLTDERIRQVETRTVEPWANPVFADFVMVRDYLEERALKSGFRLVYPVEQTLPLFLPCFDRLEYWDLVFNAWICMPEPKKLQLASCSQFWHLYTTVMENVSAGALEEDLEEEYD